MLINPRKIITVSAITEAGDGRVRMTLVAEQVGQLKLTYDTLAEAKAAKDELRRLLRLVD
ncbi:MULTISPECIES: hypothetical protein [unclassified Stenotrophomonas]|uniref:hypothetical protein n=1 Tax=unclassified Stenotrophomonas TaxID=196198 RepID=UPI0026013416|nr:MULTISPECIES: hypothetical protein [unclassified Stenotrophomonas]